MVEVITFLQQEFIPRFVEFVAAPINHPEMLWMSIPLITVLVLMQFYFGVYKQEELGWNTAVGNSLVLIFIVIDLVRYMVTTYGFNYILLNPVFYPNLLLIFILTILGFWLLLMNFFHWLPKKVAFFIASPLPINILAYMALVITYANIKLDIITISVAILLFVMLFLFFFLMKLILPKGKSEVDLPTLKK